MDILKLILDMILLTWELAVDSGFYDIVAWLFIVSLTMMIFAMIWKGIWKEK